MITLQSLDEIYNTAERKKVDTKVDHLDDFDAIVVKIAMIASSPFINAAAWKRNSGSVPIKAEITVRNFAEASNNC